MVTCIKSSNCFTSIRICFYPIKNAENIIKRQFQLKSRNKVIDDKTLEGGMETPVPYFDSLVAFKTYMPLNRSSLTKQVTATLQKLINYVFWSVYNGKMDTWLRNSV